MCFLLTCYKLNIEYPIIVAANRDEYSSRISTEPKILEARPRVFAAQDLKAGGTWLGLNDKGVVVGVLNRESSNYNEGRRSRGLLCKDALGLAAAEQIKELVERERHNYNFFNLFYADFNEAYITYAEDAVRTEKLEPGCHIISSGDMDDFDNPKIQRAASLIFVIDLTDISNLTEGLKTICRDHQFRDRKKDNICIHGEDFGTLSSTILAVNGKNLARSIYLYAAGAPCTSSYNDYSHLFRF